eukprot:scaffold331_cov349-Prasinococcus_capsulatus_cf.AAC.4
MDAGSPPRRPRERRTHLREYEDEVDSDEDHRRARHGRRHRSRSRERPGHRERRDGQWDRVSAPDGSRSRDRERGAEREPDSKRVEATRASATGFGRGRSHPLPARHSEGTKPPGSSTEFLVIDGVTPLPPPPPQIQRALENMGAMVPLLGASQAQPLLVKPLELVTAAAPQPKGAHLRRQAAGAHSDSQGSHDTESLAYRAGYKKGVRRLVDLTLR